jgi:tetratricopeptide (TPR) repeat protein
VKPSVSAELATAARLMGRWDFPAARDALQKTVAGADAAGRAGTLDGLTGRRMLAEALRELGETGRAYELARTVSRECRDRYGDAHPATIRAVAVLAAVLHDRGELDEAQRHYERAIRGTAGATGPAARAVLLARANLALLHRDRGDTATAVRELTGAYTLHRRAFGAGDPETIRLAVELGRLHTDVGDLPAARRLLAVAHAAARGALGEEHPLATAVEAALAAVESPMPSAPDAEPVPRPERTRGRAVARLWTRRSGRPGLAGRPRIRFGPRTRLGWRPVTRRGVHLAAVTATCLAALLAVAGAVVAVANRPVGAAEHRPAGTPGTPARAPRPAPRDLVLRDEGTSITVSWSDPSGGTAQVLLAVAEAGQPTGPLRGLAAGTREKKITDLDAVVDYCVVLAEIYPDDAAARAAQVCTHRHALVDTANMRGQPLLRPGANLSRSQTG